MTQEEARKRISEDIFRGIEHAVATKPGWFDPNDLHIRYRVRTDVAKNAAGPCPKAFGCLDGDEIQREHWPQPLERPTVKPPTWMPEYRSWDDEKGGYTKMPANAGFADYDVCFPRRNQVDLYTPAELAIRQAMLAVESAGAHPLLTDAVDLLRQAKDKVADFVELPTNNTLR